MLTLWIRPALAALAVLAWICLAGATLSELGTLPHALRAAASHPQPEPVAKAARAFACDTR